MLLVTERPLTSLLCVGHSGCLSLYISTNVFCVSVGKCYQRIMQHPFPSLPPSPPPSAVQHLKQGGTSIGVDTAVGGASGMNRLTPPAGQGLPPDPFLRKVTKLPRRRQPTQSSAQYTSQRLPPDYHPLPLLRGGWMEDDWPYLCTPLLHSTRQCLSLLRCTCTYTQDALT